MTTTDLRLYFLTVISLSDRQIHNCKTVATSLELAEAQAAAHYGPLELNAWGTSAIDAEWCVMGGGTFIPSRHDAQITPHELSAISA